MSERTPTLEEIAPRMIEDDGLGDDGDDAPVESTPSGNVNLASQQTPVKHKRIARARVDLADVEIEKKAVVPPKLAGNASPWPPVLSKLAVGTSIFLPGYTPAGLGYVRPIAKKMGIRIAIITDTNDEGQTGARIGRIADTDEPQSSNDGLE
jgi:hypothetical protein